MTNKPPADIAILYEDADILAINKPAGMLVHDDGKRESEIETVVEWLLREYPESAGVGEEPIHTDSGEVIDRSGIVHRLDRDTSGVMLVARTQAGHACLKAQFQNHTIIKRYEAIVYGAMKQESYTVESPIGRAKTFGRWSAIPKALRGSVRQARTDFQVLARFEYAGQAYTRVLAMPHTGRTHQIRVHLQYLNYPIVADTLYAGKRNTPAVNLGFTRQALHAHEIGFTDCAGAQHVISSPLPNDFRAALQ